MRLEDAMVLPFILVGLGAVVGANARYWLTVWAADRYGVSFPYGTLLVNVSGSVAIGVVLAFVGSAAHDAPEARFLLATGFLGAYTTFSTFMFESIALARQAEVGLALRNLVGSTVAGVAGAFLGMVAGGALAHWLR